MSDRRGKTQDSGLEGHRRLAREAVHEPARLLIAHAPAGDREPARGGRARPSVRGDERSAAERIHFRRAVTRRRATTGEMREPTIDSSHERSAERSECYSCQIEAVGTVGRSGAGAFVLRSCQLPYPCLISAAVIVSEPDILPPDERTTQTAPRTTTNVRSAQVIR